MNGASHLSDAPVLGVLGGGQLGRMTALAAAKLGIRTHVFAPEPDSPAFDVAAVHTCAPYEDVAALHRFAGVVDAVTLEWENVPTATLETLLAAPCAKPVRPGPRALSLTQDRLDEKRFINAQGLETAPFRPVETRPDLVAAVAELGLPAILKTRRFGYDGKGQATIRSGADLDGALAAMEGAPAILEGFVPFAREISVVAARTAAGETAAWDPCENEHRAHILSRTTVPARLPRALAAAAVRAAERIAAALDYVGVLAVEMFVLEGAPPRLIINEIAPRVHNSGHWTVEGAETSQFEQHVRAVMGLPLGGTARRGAVEMINLLGEDMADVPRWLATTGASVTLYGKPEARPGRKMGHVTILR